MRRGFTDWAALSGRELCSHRELLWGCEPWAVQDLEGGGSQFPCSISYLRRFLVTSSRHSRGPFISGYSRALCTLDLCACATRWHFIVEKINWLQEKKANLLRGKSEFRKII